MYSQPPLPPSFQVFATLYPGAACAPAASDNAVTKTTNICTTTNILFFMGTLCAHPRLEISKRCTGFLLLQGNFCLLQFSHSLPGNHFFHRSFQTVRMEAKRPR